MGFKQQRLYANITQEKVAEFFSIDRTTVSKWETGENLPRAEMLPKIATLYECSINDLLDLNLNL